MLTPLRTDIPFTNITVHYIAANTCLIRLAKVLAEKHGAAILSLGLCQDIDTIDGKVDLMAHINYNCENCVGVNIDALCHDIAEGGIAPVVVHRELNVPVTTNTCGIDISLSIAFIKSD